jgi:uncharacterized lipoprotein YmbA
VKRFFVLVMLLLLAGCGEQTNPTVSNSLLPTVPADIQTCFRRSAVTMPDRALTISDVESLWKQDRIRIVAMRNCGKRLLDWYESLRVNWK